MNRKTTLYATILIAWLFLTVGFVVNGRPEGLIVIIPLAVFWLAGEWRGWRWASSLSLLFYSLTAMGAIWLGVLPVLVLLGLVTAVIAWDVSNFIHLLDGMNRVYKEDLLIRQYRRRLLGAAGIGLVIAVLATIIQISFSFVAALLLGMLAIVGFSLAISFLRQESD
jgi:MFS family permease